MFSVWKLCGSHLRGLFKVKFTVMEPSVNTADCHCTISEVIVRIVLYWCTVWLYVLCMCVRKVCMYVCMCIQWKWCFSSCVFCVGFSISYARFSAHKILLEMQLWFSLTIEGQWFLCVPRGLTLTNFTFCLHSEFMCFIWISEQTAIISPSSIN